MDFRTVTDVNQAKQLWNELSPHQTIDDEWKFRHAFFKPLTYTPHFIAGFENGKVIGLLPLQKNTGEGLMPPYHTSKSPFLEFFGGDDTDDNKIIQRLYSQLTFEDFRPHITLPTYLAPLDPQYESVPGVTFYETKYFINVSNYKSHEDFLRDKWSKDSRKKMLQQIRKIYNEHTVEILENNYEDIELLSSLNVQRFGDKSSFSHAYRKRVFEDLTTLYDVIVLTLVIDGKKQGVCYGIHYKNTYIGMNAGVNNEVPDLPKLLIMLQIDKTINLGCTIYDAGKGDSGWKEMYKLDKQPQYQLHLS